MRIIGGKFRGRRLHGPDNASGPELRPTRDRVRESMFNFLFHGGYADPPAPEGMRVLDLFSGTGALGLEALSRGAEWCTFVDVDPKARALIRRNLDALGLMGKARVWRRDACNLATNRGFTFDLVLLDPPFGSNRTEPALRSALDGGWLSEHAMAALESETRNGDSTPDGWVSLFRRQYGETTLTLMRRVLS